MISQIYLNVSMYCNLLDEKFERRRRSLKKQTNLVGLFGVGINRKEDSNLSICHRLSFPNRSGCGCYLSWNVTLRISRESI